MQGYPAFWMILKLTLSISAGRSSKEAARRGQTFGGEYRRHPAAAGALTDGAIDSIRLCKGLRRDAAPWLDRRAPDPVPLARFQRLDQGLQEYDLRAGSVHKRAREVSDDANAGKPYLMLISYDAGSVRQGRGGRSPARRAPVPSQRRQRQGFPPPPE
jgi:hypothetical protein